MTPQSRRVEQLGRATRRTLIFVLLGVILIGIINVWTGDIDKSNVADMAVLYGGFILFLALLYVVNVKFSRFIADSYADKGAKP